MVHTSIFPSNYSIQTPYYQNMVIYNTSLYGLCVDNTSNVFLFIYNSFDYTISFQPLDIGRALGVYLNVEAGTIICSLTTEISGEYYLNIYTYNISEQSLSLQTISSGSIKSLNTCIFYQDYYYCLGINTYKNTLYLTKINNENITFYNNNLYPNYLYDTNNIISNQCILYSICINSSYNLCVNYANPLGSLEYIGALTFNNQNLTALNVTTNMVYCNDTYYTTYISTENESYIISFIITPTAMNVQTLTQTLIPNSNSTTSIYFTYSGLTYNHQTHLMYFISTTNGNDTNTNNPCIVYSYNPKSQDISMLVSLPNVLFCSCPLTISEKGDTLYGMGTIRKNTIGDGIFTISLIPKNPVITLVVPTTTTCLVYFNLEPSIYPANNIQYSTNNGKSFYITSNITSPLTISGLFPETTYTIVLRAINNVGNSDSSNAINTKTLAIPVPIANICFVANTLIQTDQGNFPIQHLRPNYHSINHEPIQAITKTLPPNNDYLIEIQPHALGYCIPNKKTIISPLHYIYYKNKWIKANKLANTNKYCTKIPTIPGEYLFNVLMKTHSSMKVHGMLVETLHPQNMIAQLYQSQQEKNIEKFQQIIKQCSFSLL